MPEQLRHLVVPNPKMAGRIGSWATAMLTACGEILPPPPLPLDPATGLPTHPDLGDARGLLNTDKRQVTLRMDLVTCEACKAWAATHPEKLVQEGPYLVVRR